MSKVACRLPIAGRLCRSGTGRSRSYTRRLYKPLLKDGSRPKSDIQGFALHVAFVLEDIYAQDANRQSSFLELHYFLLSLRRWVSIRGFLIPCAHPWTNLARRQPAPALLPINF
jgi:hypothetical protein